MDAQSYPLPGSKSEAPVLCTGCSGTNPEGLLNNGLPTYPYGSPLVDHVGRYVDSQTTGNFQHVGIRTIRARQMRTYPQTNGTAPPRIFIQMGNAVGGYSLDTFFTSKLPGGLKSVRDVARGADRWGAPLEKLVIWDGYMYPEAADSDWIAPLVDQQDPLGKGGSFDLDDRGYLYATFPTFGWGIARDNGGSGAAHFPKVVQMTPGGDQVDQEDYPNTRDDRSGVPGDSIISIRVGNKYYAVIAATTNGSAVFEVTDPTVPRLASNRTGTEAGVRKWDRSDATSRVAYLDGNTKSKLHVYSYSDFVVGGSAIVSFTGKDGGFTDVAFDDAGNVWASESSRLWKLSPAGSSYTVTEYTPFGPNFGTIRAMAVGAGHIAVVGTDRLLGVHYDVRIAKIEAGGPRLLDVDNFFKNYYHGNKAGYAEPGQYTLPCDLQIVKWGGKTYLFYSAEGLGDVFEIQGGDSISATMKTTSFGTVNPNAKPTESGPFPGDIVTFVATSSNPNVSYDVSWDFGNEESPSNNDLERTGLDVTHQYTGLNTSAKVTAPKVVRAIAVSDTTVNSQLNVVLKLPTARIGVSGQTTTVAATTTVPLEVVAGASFKDASDGSVEGHYGVWTIDGVPTKLRPNESLPVGAVGAHTLKFEAFYGKYDASFNGTAPYATPAINIPYVVKPFRVRLDTPSTPNATTVRFSGTPEFTTDPSIITATQWTVSWSLTGGAAAGGVSTNAVVPPLSGSYNVGVIPHFDVPKADVISGSTVTLQINIDPAGLSTPAQPYAQVSASSLLTTPDPRIEQVGCANANSPCKFTARSIGGASTSDWTILWTLKRTGRSDVTSTANPFEPTLTEAGNYTIFLKASKTVFEKEVDSSLTVQQSLCGSLPLDHQVSINKLGCSTGCAVGTTINFTPSFNGYQKQTCDSFSWSFGDGGTATGETASHAYTSSGTKTVQFKVTNTNGVFTETTTVSITGGTTPPPPPPACTVPAGINFTWSGCSSGGCRTTDNIKFTATRGAASLATCDFVTWSFGDDNTSTQKSPTRSYATAGTYTVSVVVSNTEGTAAPVSKTITISNPPAGNCNAAPGPGNFAITFTGVQSGCTLSNGQACKAGEGVDFVSNNYIYPVASCDSFEWDFGDSTAKSSTRHPQHVYANNGTYSVQLKVSNNAGNFVYTRSVAVAGGAPAQPVPTITGTFATAAQKGKAVTFTASSNMATTTGWTWTFGDGTPADTSQAGTTGQSSTITHTFNSVGTFTVTAKARNSTDVASAPVGSTQSNITITEAPAIPEYKYLLPVAVHAGGQNNSSWRTDVQIYNPDLQVSVQKPLEMTASFKGQTYNLVVTKATHIYEDFLGRILDHDDQGPVVITTKTAMVAPQIWTRTYNQAQGGGTFGQFIPAIRIDAGAGSGAAFGEGKYYLSGLRHDNRYRTNVGFVNPNVTAINATVTVRDDRFLAIAQFTRTLQPFQLDQFTLKNLVPTLPTDRPFSLQIEVPPGQWVIAYASFIDGISNDPVFLQAVRESEVASDDHRVSVIPGVGHTGQWRSDVTIFNPDEEGVQFDLEYFDNAGTKLAGATGVFLRSREFLQYSDILASGVFGSNVPDGLGMLKISATTAIVPNSRYPMTFARTYFDDGANGTFGQGIVGFSVGRPNVKVNQPAIIAGVRQSAAYRTNIGLVNVSNVAVTATITLLDPLTGAVASSLQYPLAPNQSIVGPYNGWGSIESGTLKIEATGSVWAFASIIDNKTKDPEYVPATPIQQ